MLSKKQLSKMIIGNEKFLNTVSFTVEHTSCNSMDKNWKQLINSQCITTDLHNTYYIPAFNSLIHIQPFGGSDQLE